MKKSLLASLSIHLLIVLGLFFKVRQPDPTPTLLTVEYLPSPQPAGRSASGEKRLGRKNKNLGALSPTLNRLSGAVDFGLQQEIKHPHSWTEDKTGNWTDDAWGSGGAGAGGSGLKMVELTLPLEKLYVEIEGMLNYPAALARRNIEGTVNARLVFTADSTCDQKKMVVSSTNPYFRVYILALLKKLCSLETVAHIGLRKNQHVDLSFRFAVVGILTPAQADLKRGAISGNVLLFTRDKLRMPLEYQIGPLQGTLLYPYVSVDFTWIGEHWDTWVNGKDPLRDFKESW